MGDEPLDGYVVAYSYGFHVILILLNVVFLATRMDINLVYCDDICCHTPIYLSIIFISVPLPIISF